MKLLYAKLEKSKACPHAGFYQWPHSDSLLPDIGKKFDPEQRYISTHKLHEAYNKNWEAEACGFEDKG